MYSAASTTITEVEIPLKSWKFNITNGNKGSMTISDPLLDNVEAATQRAKSEFLSNSYRMREIRFSTYRTDFVKNMVINVQGLPYLVKSITTQIGSKSIRTSIRAVRYE